MTMSRIGRVRLIGELDRPAFRILAGVDLEKAGAVVAAHETILPPLDLELAVGGAHKGLALPFAAALVHRIDVIVLRRQRAAQKRRAVERLEVPPAFADPALAVGIGERDA